MCCSIFNLLRKYMTDFFNDIAQNETNDAANAEAQDQAVVGKTPKTKEEQIAIIDGQITKLQKRRQDLIDGVVSKPAAKVVALPEVGAVIEFRFGRTNEKTSKVPVIKTGTVIAVRPAVADELKKSPAQVRVSVGEGFDVELLTIYPAQIVEAVEPAAAE
jgi:hypothetical protein